MISQRTPFKFLMLMGLLICLGLLLASCSRFPPRPDIELCQLSIADSKAYCAFTVSDKQTEIEIKDMDHYIAISPDDFKKLNEYVNELKKRIINDKKSNIEE